MIAKSYILNNLTIIENLYLKSSTAKKALFHSKLAILELCGWIEESMDDIIRTCASRHLKKQDNLRQVEKDIIKPTYGFEYNRHFRNMLLQLLGIINLERLEHALDPVKFQLMESTLETLKTCRDREAHTHLKGATKTLDAPSVTKYRFLLVYAGLKDIEAKVKSLQL
ncbi:MAG: hypothetical protein ISS53_03160 [Dehalococcoidia bacterium]|nr:hypothetical protein [Dehalococcoidia bacterium]